MKVVVNNNPEEIEARAWINTHKEENAYSWPQFDKLTDVNGNTLSTFASGKYGGRNDEIAVKVLAYRNRLAAQDELDADLPTAPEWLTRSRRGGSSMR